MIKELMLALSQNPRLDVDQNQKNMSYFQWFPLPKKVYQSRNLLPY